MCVFFDERREADIQVDCEGQILCAGFIDLQINGKEELSEKGTRTLSNDELRNGKEYWILQ